MYATQFSSVALNRAIGYKVKNEDGQDLLFLRWNGYGWSDHRLPGRFWSEDQARAMLAATAEHFRTEVIAWQCCCDICNHDDNRTIAARYFQSTGDTVSHGYAPECYAAQMKIVQGALAIARQKNAAMKLAA